METRKIIVKKIDENFEIASVLYSGSIELKDKVLIKGNLVCQFIEMLKKIDHAPDEDIEDNPVENMIEKSLGEINVPDCSIYLGVRKFNYSNEPCELVLSSFWEDDSVDSAFINLPYTDFEDLRNQLDFLIGELTKENAE